MKRKEAIKKLQNREAQIFNDLLPSTKEIKKLLKEAFPDDDYLEKNPTQEKALKEKYYSKYNSRLGAKAKWWFTDFAESHLPIIKLSTITKRKKTKLIQLETLISDLAKDVSELRQTLAKDVEVDVEEVKSELIVGEWHWIKNETAENALVVIQDKNVKYTYGFNHIFNFVNIYRNDLLFSTFKKDVLRKATPQEVQAALENEAKKRGFEERNIKIVNFKCIYNIFTKGYCLSDDLKRLYYNGKCVFNEGKFAEIIQQETIKEEEIDFSAQELFIYEKGTYIVCSNGKQNLGGNTFEGKVIYSTGRHQNINYFSKNWAKDDFKKFKGELTIK